MVARCGELTAGSALRSFHCAVVASCLTLRYFTGTEMARVDENFSLYAFWDDEKCIMAMILNIDACVYIYL